jgi:hypothetical protein
MGRRGRKGQLDRVGREKKKREREGKEREGTLFSPSSLFFIHRQDSEANASSCSTCYAGATTTTTTTKKKKTLFASAFYFNRSGKEGEEKGGEVIETRKKKGMLHWGKALNNAAFEGGKGYTNEQ